MSNVIDLLLQGDESRLKKPGKEVELPRLSELFGGRVVFACEALSMQKMAEIRDSIDTRDKNAEPDMTEMQVFTIIEGVKSPSFKNRQLLDRFNAPTPKELVNKLLLPGEIFALYNTISGLSGFGDDVIKEIKN